MRPRIFAGTTLAALLAAALPAFAQAPEAAQPASPPMSLAVDPPVASDILANVEWLDRPDASAMSRYYPLEAVRQGVGGQALLSCLVNSRGRLDCAVAREEPMGLGIGEAAVRVSQHYRMAPVTRDGRPTAGGRVYLPIRFGQRSAN